MIDAIIYKLKLAENKVIVNIQNYANTPVVTITIAMAEIVEQIK